MQWTGSSRCGAPRRVVEQFQEECHLCRAGTDITTWKELWNPSGLFTSKYVWLNRDGTGNVPAPCVCAALRSRDASRRTRRLHRTCMHANTHTHKQTSLSHLQPGEVMKTNGRVLFPLGTEEELSHQANFILVWPRDSISSGCFYKCRAAPRHRPVMDMRAWWPDGRCWPCNSSSKHSLMTPPPPHHHHHHYHCECSSPHEILLLVCKCKPFAFLTISNIKNGLIYMCYVFYCWIKKMMIEIKGNISQKWN